MLDDFARLAKLERELIALRDVCDSDFLRRSIEAVIADIHARLATLGPGSTDKPRNVA